MLFIYMLSIITLLVGCVYVIYVIYLCKHYYFACGVCVCDICYLFIIVVYVFSLGKGDVGYMLYTFPMFPFRTCFAHELVLYMALRVGLEPR